jgi:hypothetical protein
MTPIPLQESVFGLSLEAGERTVAKDVLIKKVPLAPNRRSRAKGPAPGPKATPLAAGCECSTGWPRNLASRPMIG